MADDKPRVLFIDIETQPDLFWAWGVYESNALEVAEHWQLLSFSAEWLGGKSITKALPDYDGYNPGGSDKKLAKDIWDLLNEADIVIAHNGAQFDLKKLNARFIQHRFPPPSPYRIIDTKREIKRVAAFSSNKLEWLCRQLEIGEKIHHEGWPLWKGCMLGDKTCWRKMKKYNKHDIDLLKELYLLISPWINHHRGTDITCTNPACASTNLERRGYQRNKTRIYQRFQCKDCGSWSRAVFSEKGNNARLVHA